MYLLRHLTTIMSAGGDASTTAIIARTSSFDKLISETGVWIPCKLRHGRLLFDWQLGVPEYLNF